MATGTLIFRPSADVSFQHTASSGSTGYNMIADATADDNSTYISQTLSSTSSTSMNSVFTLTTNSTIPIYDFKITEARLYSRAMGASNNAAGSYNCYFAAGTASGGSSANAATSGTLTSGSYATASSTSTELMNSINTELQYNGELPIISVRVNTTGTKSSDKNASNGYIRVTQVYLELDYEDAVFEPPAEEEGVTYHSLTISSINATTNLGNGTTRVVEGTNQTIEIIPDDPILTAATDNGVDIRSQLVVQNYTNTYTVTPTKSGASYGFPLNNQTGYYTSNNNGRGNSAAVCRIDFNLHSPCVLTIDYINYAQAQNDYGIFGNIDVALGNTYTADTNAYYICNTANDNTANVRTLTYNIPAGTHFIDIKYRKNNQTNQNNDNLQWKITGFDILGPTSSYTYTLNNITDRHSLTFVFGEVTYYTISATGTNCRLFPDGQVIIMPGNSYNLNIVPNSITDIIGISDNGNNVTANLIKEKGMNQEGDTIVSYSYELANINANHTLQIVAVTADSILYEKVNGTWTVVVEAYYKENGRWEKKDLSFFNDMDLTYMKKGT